MIYHKHDLTPSLVFFVVSVNNKAVWLASAGSSTMQQLFAQPTVQSQVRIIFGINPAMSIKWDRIGDILTLSNYHPMSSAFDNIGQMKKSQNDVSLCAVLIMNLCFYVYQLSF